MIILAEVGRSLVEKQRHHRSRPLLCPPALRALLNIYGPNLYICAIAFKSAKHKLSNAFPKLLAIKSLAAVQGAIDEHEEQDADVVRFLLRNWISSV